MDVLRYDHRYIHVIDTMRSQYNFDLWAIDVPAGVDATSGQISEEH